jgi:RimJ/RimL family protein N-acetyltransferase
MSSALSTLGRLVEPVAVPSALRDLSVTGRDVVLRAPRPQDDADRLYDAFSGDDTMWNWMAYGPFENRAAFADWMAETVQSADPRWFLVADRQDDRPLGMAALMNHAPAHRRLELGHIWYVAEARGRTVNTEVAYLAAREAFEHHRARRFEWKCDALNTASRTAALRLGFRFEGIFRQHLIVKGRNRDTAWFALTDADWPTARARLERWLYTLPRDANGRPQGSLSALQGG